MHGGRRSRRLLLMSFIFFACADPAEPPMTEPVFEQLLLNGSVELGTGAPDHWRTVDISSGDYEFDWVDGDGWDGSRSLAIRASPNAQSGAFWAQSVAVSDLKGVLLRLTAFVKVNDISGPGVGIAVRGDDTSLNNGSGEAFATTQGLERITGTRGWQRTRVGLTGVPDEVDEITVFLIQLPGSSGEVLFDDISLSIVDDGILPGPQAYVSAVLDIMEDNSIKRYLIDWPSFKVQTWEDVAGAEATSDTYRGIELAIGRLGDGHSFFRRPPLAATSLSPIAPPSLAPKLARDPGSGVFEDRFGYLEVPAFTGQGQEAHDLATQYHRLIESVDSEGVCGWIINLRGNTGGNMWPMVAGVGPILGEGVAGFFVDPDSVVDTWSYSNGSSQLNGVSLANANQPYQLLSPAPPVAVLTDSLTASSGEAAAISFRGRPGARSFGAPTWGVSTANRGYPLSDGATLVLTVSTMADRTGRLYGEEVPPDEIVEGPKTGDPATDPALGAAIEWLGGSPQCSD